MTHSGEAQDASVGYITTTGKLVAGDSISPSIGLIGGLFKNAGLRHTPSVANLGC
jgi:hypothetical protein